MVPSNRVCIYAPRFAAVRRVVQPIAHEQPVFVNQTLEEAVAGEGGRSIAADCCSSSGTRWRSTLASSRRACSANGSRPAGWRICRRRWTRTTSLAAYANLEIIRTGEVSDAEKPLVERSSEAAITLTGIQAPQVVFGVKQAHAQVGVRQPGIIYQTDEPNHPRLRLIKLASCGHALPGEEVEFTLRFDNIGDQVIGNVTIVDNLSTRLEYVPDTAKSSVDADFITQVERRGLADPALGNQRPGEAGRRRRAAVPREGAVGSSRSRGTCIRSRRATR